MFGRNSCCLTGRGGKECCKVAASAVFLRCGGRVLCDFDLLPQLRDLNGGCLSGHTVPGATEYSFVAGEA